MFGNMGNMGAMIKQAQELQNRIQKVQAEIGEIECTGEAGAGLVKVTLNGRHEARKVEIDPSIFADDKDMCEDLIVAAINDAARRVEEAGQQRMAEATQGLKLPAGMKLPF